MEGTLFWLATTLYALASLVGLAGLALRWERGATAGSALLGAALLPHAGALALRWIEVGHGPWASRHAVISADAFLLVAVWLLAAQAARGYRGLAALVAPAALLLMGWAAVTSDAERELPILFKSGFLVLQVASARLAFAAVLLASLCAAAWLVRARSPAAPAPLPGPERLALQTHQLTLVSFLFQGVMVVAGALWAQQSSGRFWGGHPAEASSLVAWLLLASVLHLRALHRWSGDRTAWLTLAALGFALVALLAMPVPAILDV